jgi:tRNA pseudouridine38-40 synthase
VNTIPEKMTRYAVATEFDGSAFHGWQRQDNAPSVQACLEDAWLSLTGEAITLRGGSRTDAGVSAIAHVSDFASATSIPPDRIARAWNTKLPESVVVRAAVCVPNSFYARYDTLGKTYRYAILTGETRPVIKRRTTAFVPGELDLDAMRAASEILLGTHDFSSFMDQGSPTKRLVRTLHDIQIDGCKELAITMTADGFLYHMARIIAGTLVYVGQGKISVRELDSIIEARDRVCAGPTMPAEGLVLERVYFASELFGDDCWPYEDERRESKRASLPLEEPPHSSRHEG